MAASETGRALPDWFREDCWVPPPGDIETRRVWRFMQAQGMSDYREFLRRAAAEPEWFYPAAFADLDLVWPEPFDQVREGGNDPGSERWFVGGRTSLTHLAVDRWRETDRRDEIALIWEGDDGSHESVSFEQLGDLVERVAGGLLQLGIGTGDRVGLFMPMIVEAQAAALAIARIGAIAVPVFSGYGPHAVAERLNVGQVKALISADSYTRRGKVMEMFPRAQEAVAMSPSVEHHIVVWRGDGGSDSDRNGVIGWDELVSGPADREVRLFDTDTPYLLMFTSGSTGTPKGTLHTHGGLPYRAPLEQAYCLDLGPGDRLTWVTDMGWVMGVLAPLSALSLGASFVLSEGVPDYPDPSRLWQMVEKHEITHIGLSPTLIRQLRARGEEWVEPYEMPTLRAAGSTGEPWTAVDWRWMHRHVGRGRMPIINLSGGTEIGCCILAGSPIVETPECQFSGASPGMSAAVFNEQGESVVGTVGELVLTDSWPSKTVGLWGDDKRYDSYWSRWPGVWLNGDRAIQHASGCWELLGRSDDVLKLAGKRTGPAEIEGAAVSCDSVVAAAAVGIPDEVKGQALIVVAVPTEPIEGDERRDAVAAEVSDRIAEHLGGPLRPHKVFIASELPTSRNGKVMRRLIRAWITGDDPGDLSTLDNPGAKEAIQRAAGVAAGGKV